MEAKWYSSKRQTAGTPQIMLLFTSTHHFEVKTSKKISRESYKFRVSKETELKVTERLSNEVFIH